MRFGTLIVITALIVVLVLFLGKSRQSNPVAEGTAALEKAKAATLTIDMNSVSAAVTTYFGDHNEYPESLDSLVPGYLPSPDSLIDSWGTPFQLEKDDAANITLVSAGPDRLFTTGDDIRRRL
ncbi:MAG: hypothetical protein NTW95_01705 [Candidatus Aminicenantes bacterium]|nr:hypothetical protein [Candidatus Aminicenantes bacterium]